MARGTTRQQLARRGILVLACIVLLGVVMTLRSNGTFGEAPHVSANIATAGGALRKGSDVKLNGAMVGKVSSITRNEETNETTLELTMEEDAIDFIPNNVVARVLPATVFGTTYVDLIVHGSPSEDPLEAGDDIKADKTQETLELQQALDDIDRLTKALGPADLQSAISSAAAALDGRGNKLGQAVRTINSYLDRLNGRMPAVRSDLDDLAVAFDVIDEVAPDLLDAADDSLVFLDTVVTQEAALTSLLAGGTQLAITSREFMSKNQRNLVRWINNTGAFVDVLYDNRRAGITDAISINLVLGDTLARANDRGFLWVDANVQTGRPPYYSSGHSLAYATTQGMDAMVGDGQ